jgi:hypothetical protein
MDSVLRPRDIQARIRAGETPEDVAAAAQTSVDKIMGFATPVLAERAYQAELAQKASVRRRTATGPVGHLGQAVETFLEPHGLTTEDVEWDAWRREDGRWTVLATFLSGAAQQTARFTYDTGGRFVVADNDEARTLVGERTAEEAAAPSASASITDPDSASDSASASDDRLVEDDEHQLALGDDTLGMVLGRPATPTGAAPGAPTAPAAPSAPAAPRVPSPEPEVTEDLTPVARALRPPVTPPAGTGDADWIVTQASERPERRAEPAAEAVVEEPAAEPVAEAPVAEPAAEEPVGVAPAPVADEPVEEPVAEEAPVEPSAPAEPVAVRPTRPVAVPPVAERVEPQDPFEEALFAAPVPEPRQEAAPAARDAASDPEADAERAEPARKPAAKAGRGRGRASVPSWDEIMFGTPKDS